jgi:ABC-type uncharacterized transport system substrate-binding protein
MLRRGIIALAALLASVIAAAAHPHVWASVHSEIELGAGRKVEAIRQVWTFDEFYSAMALQGLDTDGDGKYSKAELAPLAEVNVSSLKEFDYFTFVSAKGEKVPLKEPIDYWVTADDKGIVTLHFTLPLAAPLTVSGDEVQLDVYDPTFFVAFSFAKTDPVRLGGTPAPGCSAAVDLPEATPESQALSEAFFSQLGPTSDFGAQFSQTAILSCQN